jgi:hypothetical protein
MIEPNRHIHPNWYAFLRGFFDRILGINGLFTTKRAVSDSAEDEAPRDVLTFKSGLESGFHALSDCLARYSKSHFSAFLVRSSLRRIAAPIAHKRRVSRPSKSTAEREIHPRMA